MQKASQGEGWGEGLWEWGRAIPRGRGTAPRTTLNRLGTNPEPTPDRPDAVPTLTPDGPESILS